MDIKSFIRTVKYRLFATPEVKSSLNAVNDVANSLKGCPLYSNFKDLMPVVNDLIRYSDKTTQAIRYDNCTPRNYALFQLTEAILWYLPRYSCFVYRGTLSMQGQAVSGLFRYAINELEQSGFYSPDEAKQELISFNEFIKNLG